MQAIKIYKTNRGIVIQHDNDFFLSSETDWDTFINRKDLFKKVNDEIKGLRANNDLSELVNNSTAPIGNQEIWAAGVTYLRSREARMEESKDAGGGDFYAKVYDASRPELFFKATAYRAVGSGDVVRIRKDSQWNVPEPELTLFICSLGSIEGYTVGNDMSSRDIEGENPLYLPQAKSYNASAAIGPCLYIPGEPIDPDSMIRLEIKRKNKLVFSGEISINRMKRKHQELIEYLFRETSFPNGVFLMTGTGIVPPDHFTLNPGDEIKIAIDNIGTLVNTVG
ncbi:MAG TPA: fumarylacetoacetate hydrolase family protein [Chitinophagaceae bacterium]|jgi:2-dehydro-3-deoxy-D-arabinonate dehydratase|nr:fumarylacetoacetate hydrolase family protein [Chitinophagaceae bacterium]